MASITSRKGDRGTTSLAGGKRVPKNHPRVCAYGEVDELSALLTAARASVSGEDAATLKDIQGRLLKLTAELACPPEEAEAFFAKRPRLDAGDLAALDEDAARLEAMGVSFRDWLEPIARDYALIEVARAVCRRAERSAWTLAEKEAVRPELMQFLNRLSDVLWLLARKPDAEQGP